MFFKLDDVFAPLSFFCERGRLEISFSTYVIRHIYWFNSFPFKQKIQKMNRHLLGKNLDFSYKTQHFS